MYMSMYVYYMFLPQFKKKKSVILLLSNRNLRINEVEFVQVDSMEYL